MYFFHIPCQYHLRQIPLHGTWRLCLYLMTGTKISHWPMGMGSHIKDSKSKKWMNGRFNLLSPSRPSALPRAGPLAFSNQHKDSVLTSRRLASHGLQHDQHRALKPCFLLLTLLGEFLIQSACILLPRKNTDWRVRDEAHLFCLFCFSIGYVF